MYTPLQQFRQRNPEYNDLGDDQLLRALHAKDYRDTDFDRFSRVMRGRPAAQVQVSEPTMSDRIDDGLATQQRESDPLSAPAPQARQTAVDPDGFAIDTSRPYVYNDDGSRSTETTRGFNLDGREYNIPTIVNGQRVSDEEAIAHAREQMAQGWEYPNFDTIEEAEEAAQRRSDSIAQARAEHPLTVDDLLEFSSGAESPVQKWLADLDPPTDRGTINNTARRMGERGLTLMGNAIRGVIGTPGAALDEWDSAGGGRIIFGTDWGPDDPADGKFRVRYMHGEERARFEASHDVSDIFSETLPDYLISRSFGYVPEHTTEAIKNAYSDGNILGTMRAVFGFGFEQGFGSIPDMLMVMSGIPGIATYIMARSSEMGEVRAENKGLEDATFKEQLEALPFAALSAGAELVGAAKIFQAFGGRAAAQRMGQEMIERGLAAAARRIGGRTLNAAITEAGTEAFQEGVLEYLGEKLGTDAPMSWAEAGERGFFGGLGGGTGALQIAGPLAITGETVRALDNVMLDRMEADYKIAAADSEAVPDTDFDEEGNIVTKDPEPEPPGEPIPDTTVDPETGEVTTVPQPDTSPISAIGQLRVSRETLMSVGAMKEQSSSEYTIEAHREAIEAFKADMGKVEAIIQQGEGLRFPPTMVEAAREALETIQSSVPAAYLNAEDPVPAAGDKDTEDDNAGETQIAPDPAPDPDEEVYGPRNEAGQLIDPRLKRETFRIHLAGMASELIAGGDAGVPYREFTEPSENDPMGQGGVITGRSPSLNPAWFQNMNASDEFSMSVRQVQNAVDKALQGKRLGIRQARVVTLMLDSITDIRTDLDSMNFAVAELAAARRARAGARDAAAGNLGTALGPLDPELEEGAGDLMPEGEYIPEMDAEARIVQELAAELDAWGEAVQERVAIILANSETTADAMQALEELLHEQISTQPGPPSEEIEEGPGQPAEVEAGDQEVTGPEAPRTEAGQLTSNPELHDLLLTVVAETMYEEVAAKKIIELINEARESGDPILVALAELKWAVYLGEGFTGGGPRNEAVAQTAYDEAVEATRFTLAQEQDGIVPEAPPAPPPEDVSPDIGVAGDLFSEDANRQVDIADVPPAPEGRITAEEYAASLELAEPSVRINEANQRLLRGMRLLERVEAEGDQWLRFMPMTELREQRRRLEAARARGREELIENILLAARRLDDNVQRGKDFVRRVRPTPEPEGITGWQTGAPAISEEGTAKYVVMLMSPEDSQLADNWKKDRVPAYEDTERMDWRQVKNLSVEDWTSRIVIHMDNLAASDDTRPVTLTRLAQDLALVPEGATLGGTNAETALWQSVEDGVIEWSQDQGYVEFRIVKDLEPAVDQRYGEIGRMTIAELDAIVTLPIAQLEELESAYLDELEEEIKRDGMTVPITVSVRDGKPQLIFDGMHRLAVMHRLGIKDAVVRMIGTRQAEIESMAQDEYLAKGLGPAEAAARAIGAMPSDLETIGEPAGEVEFEKQGIQYRAHMEGAQVVVEALDGSTWNRTGSLDVNLEARRLLGQSQGPMEVDPALQDAVTGELFEALMYRGHGREDAGSMYGGIAEPLLGTERRYYAFRRQDAAEFGPEIEAIPVRLESPLVISSDQDFRAWHKAAGSPWYLNPRIEKGDDSERTEAEGLEILHDWAQKMVGWARGQGHDGVVVQWDPKEWRDFDEDGNEFKQMRKVWGSPQAVVFDPAEGGSRVQGMTVPILGRANVPWKMNRHGEGDLYIQRIGPNAGKPYRSRNGPNDLAISFDQDLLMPDYMFYVLEFLQPKIQARARGTAQVAIRMSDVTEVLVEHFAGQAAQRDRRGTKREGLPDRRADQTRRARVAALSMDELIEELYTDPLTGLGNRRAFEETLPHATAVASIDADNLKGMNNYLGHDAGDVLLRAVGEALKKLDNVLAFHISGDEFYLLGDTEANVTAAINAAKTDLGQQVIETPTGKVEGVTITSGIGANKARADSAMEGTKRKLEAAGVKPVSGAMPKGGVLYSRVINAEEGSNYIGMIGQHGTLPMNPNKEYVLGDGRVVKIPAEPVSRAQIIGILERRLGLRIYQGRVKGKTKLGFYRVGLGEIRTKKHNDIEVVSHEVSHWLDDRHPWISALYKKFGSEMKGVSYDATKVNEGYAEFMRHWFTEDHKARTAAPGFYDAWMSALEDHPGLKSVVLEVQMAMHGWHLQGARSRLEDKIGSQDTLMDRWRRISNKMGDRILQSVFDGIRPFKEIERQVRGQMGKAAFSGYKSLRLARGAHGVMQAIMERGTIAWDDKGDLIFNGEGLKQVFDEVSHLMDETQLYFVARRGAELMSQRRENHLRPDEIKSGIEIGDQHPEVVRAFHKWRRFNDRMLAFYLQSGIVSAESLEKIREINQNYVPFNRIVDVYLGQHTLKRRSAAPFTRLKGGTENINDVYESIVGNTAHLVQMSLVNVGKSNFYKMLKEADNQTAGLYAVPIGKDVKPTFIQKEQVLKAAIEGMGLSMAWYRQAKTGMVGSDEEIALVQYIETMARNLEPMVMFFETGMDPKGNVDFYWNQGKKEFWEIGDPRLMEAIQQIGPRPHNLAVNILGGFANVLRRGVTLTPSFQASNFIRDSMNAFTLSKGATIPVVGATKALLERIYNDHHYWEYMLNGGGFASMAQADGINRDRVMDGKNKILDRLDQGLSAFEYAARISEFKTLRAKGWNARDAALAGREISTDFAMRGSADWIRVLTIATPFLNARLQGLYRNAREVASLEDGKIKFAGAQAFSYALRSLIAITIPSMVLYALNKDDERYSNIPDWIRDLSWIVFTGPGEDDYVMIPKPFETGMLWGTLPERMMEYYYTNDEAELADAMLWMMLSTFALDATPQIAQVWVDLARNKNFTGAPIIPAHLQGVDAPEQYRAWTSDALVAFAQKTGVGSPMIAEYIIRGHFGQWGTWALGMADMLVGDAANSGAEPTQDWRKNNILMSRFVQDGPLRRTHSEDHLYEMLDATQQVVNTVRIITNRSPDRLEEYAGTPRAAILTALNEDLAGWARENRSIKNQIDLIRADATVNPATGEPYYTADQKRDEIFDLRRQANELALGVYSAINPEEVQNLIDEEEAFQIQQRSAAGAQ